MSYAYVATSKGYFANLGARLWSKVHVTMRAALARVSMNS